jgi:hypothetical protein
VTVKTKIEEMFRSVYHVFPRGIWKDTSEVADLLLIGA